MKVLVVAAHPDDEVLGAGGTIARHLQQGDQVTVAILGTGVSSRFRGPDPAEAALLEALNTDAHMAAAALGGPDIQLFALPDNRFDSVNLLDLVRLVEDVMAKVRPEIVYTHFHGDLNIDHVITARAVLTACRPLPGSLVKRLLAFEVASATGWGFPEPAFAPTVFVDIAATLPLKIEALQRYRSEVRRSPHPRSPEAVAARAQTWGAQVGLAAAEAFLLVREKIQ
jgi:LmbE family N-acetylglucosaminyl deacetylase